MHEQTNDLIALASVTKGEFEKERSLTRQHRHYDAEHRRGLSLLRSAVHNLGTTVRFELPRNHCQN
jgi:hypothetical protein